MIQLGISIRREFESYVLEASSPQYTARGTSQRKREVLAVLRRSTLTGIGSLGDTSWDVRDRDSLRQRMLQSLPLLQNQARSWHVLRPIIHADDDVYSTVVDTTSLYIHTLLNLLRVLILFRPSARPFRRFHSIDLRTGLSLAISSHSTTSRASTQPHRPSSSFELCFVGPIQVLSTRSSTSVGGLYFPKARRHVGFLGGSTAHGRSIGSSSNTG
ncbi:hypothetical protein SCHPADRAFT_219118 [Schizopora paradoxa]|uniref:Uncharacterized protein n=1 Tax=Schizopora paradoxa TaxID=27342 RepID=A0A0H2S3T0_9AGAM|nr:hypothetical protein SCHPADRAFT_219118 [Schizopora paradoxa]